MARVQNRWRWGLLAFVVAIPSTLAASAVLPDVPSREDGPGAAPRIAVAPDERTAFAAARRQDEQVMVASLTTPTRKVSAKPDGSFVAELTAQPVRALRDGTWVPIDATLATRPDGTVVPRATTTGMVFSGGGTDQPVARFGTPGRSFALTWPGRLPAPVVTGTTATYAGVLPGVDLVLRADPDGFAQHLVVKDARAAKNPALSRIRLGLTTDGLTVKAVASGALEARDAAGEVVFAAPPSAMWDAAGKRARVGVAVGAGTLTLTPDRNLLRDKAATFPIVIDPDWATSNHGGWTKVFSGKPGTSSWWGGTDDGYGKAGLCQGWPQCNGIGAARTYWMFWTGFLGDKQILSATLNATVVYGPSCGSSQHELHRTGDINAGTNWNNQPDGWHVGTVSAPSNYNQCEGYKGVGWNVNGALTTSGWSTFAIRARDEGDKYAWRKYDSGATKIVVNYNSKPNPPYEMSTDPPLPPPCKWCGGVSYVGDKTIRLRGKLSDPDNGQLTAKWAVHHGAVKEERTGPTLGSGSTFSTTVDLTGRDGKQVSWTLWGWDGHDSGGSKNGPGPFVVDLGKVETEPGVTAGLYRSDNRWHGGVGVPGAFTFDAAGVKDIDHYLYGWSDPPSMKVNADALGGKATVSIAPTKDGPQTLYVQSVDRAGHRSPAKKLHVYVRAGNGPLAQWSFEGNAEDTAFLGDRDGTLAGDATYRPGAVGSAIALDGATGYVTAPSTVRTDASFTVSAWARVEKADGARTILSQDGTTFAGLNLWYRPDDGGRWVFGMVHPDSTDMWADTAWSSARAQTGVWTHLTATYDAATNRIRLYVDGELSATQTRKSAPVDATGPLRVGRTMWDSNPGLDYFAGAIDEVKVYDRLLTDTEIRAAVSRDNVQVGHWPLDEKSATTAANAVPGGSMGVLQGGAEFTPSGAVNGAVRFDGPDAHVSMGAPAVRTDQSFTVAAWVRQERPLAVGTPDAAVSQDGAVISGFFLGYRQHTASDGLWEFYLPSADSVDRPADEGVWSSMPAKVGDWTHLAGVYDAQAKQIRLYVDGKLAGTGPRVKGFDASGPFLLGRGTWNGNVGHQWKGTVDEVRAYSRAASEEEIRGLVSQEAVTTGLWKLDGDTQDSGARGLHGTVVSTPRYTGGQSSQPDPADLAVGLDGATTAVSAPHAVDTTSSFSVAAWARLDKVGGQPAVVSEDGSRVSAFKVRVNAAGRWSFVMFDGDVVDDGTKRAEAVGAPAAVGQWTHLAAVYDAGAGQLQLYVNGALVGSMAHKHTWNATGGLQIGRAKWNGAPVEYFPGSIDDVAVYSRALFATEIQAMAGRDLSLVHHYPLDESSGRTAADAVGGRPATLTGDAAFGPGRVGNGVALDGAGDTATTSAVDLRTDLAFTVSAWVRLPARSSQPALPRRIDAVTVDGEHTSKFRLGHVIDDDQHPDGAWIFEMPESDSDGARITKAAVSTWESDRESWVHLAGVYDPATKKIWLYVDGTRVGDGTLNNAWRPAGGLAIGRGKAKSAATAYWNGGVDDVRLYAGQLDKDRIFALYRSYPAADGATTLPTADAGEWAFDENTGTTVADQSGRDHTVTLKGGAAWGGGRRGPTAGMFNGTSGYADTAGPVLDTTRGFSVAAWAYLTTADAANRAVFGQDGNRLSAFQVTYNGATKKWAAILPHADKDNPGTAVTTVGATETAPVATWTHLALTYDAALRQVRLYVNGTLSGVQVGVTVPPSTGPLSVGRARWNGANASYFAGSVDEVRAYSRTLSAGEVRRVHGDVLSVERGVFRFDESSTKDYSWYKADAVASGGTSYGPGVNGKALQLDGDTGAVTRDWNLPMFDSLTVSAWARLTRADQVATIVSQDGDRASGFVLQYRPGLNRWVFGAPESDADGAPLVYAASLVPPKVGEWTHVSGVYDYAGRQLRLYVDGQLAGTRNNVVLWRATGKLVIGRDKTNGQPSGFFPGSLDEVRTAEGVAADGVLAVRGGWPKPTAGQLARFVDAAGERYTGRTDQVRDGYHVEAVLGVPVAGGPNTRTLYACRAGMDGFTSTDAECEGQEKAGEIGLVYTQKPTNVPTTPLYRCTTGTDRFDSADAACGGATNAGPLGYTVAYASLARFALDAFEHTSTTGGPPASYRVEGTAGWLALNHETGTQPLLSCVDGVDQFVSTDPGCAGKTVLAVLGELWAEPPTEPPAGHSYRAIYRCRIGTWDSFVSVDAGCEGTTVDTRLGYVLTEVPATTAEFS